MTTTVGSLLARAASQIGTMERTQQNDVLYADYWGITGYSWCYAFVMWCFWEDNAALPFTTMYVPAGVAWSRDNLQSVERGGAPQPGDIVHFTWDMNVWPPTRPGTGDHVGIVESWDGGDWLTTIEGNVGSPQGVYRMNRPIGGTVINFWRPQVYGSGEEDMTPEQIQAQQEILELARWLKGHLQASDMGALPLVRDVYNRGEWTGRNVDSLGVAVGEVHGEVLGPVKAGTERLVKAVETNNVRMGEVAEAARVDRSALVKQVSDQMASIATTARTHLQSITSTAQAERAAITNTVKAAQQALSEQVQSLAVGGGGEVDVEAVIRGATAEQLAKLLTPATLIAALTEMFAAKGQDVPNFLTPPK